MATAEVAPPISRARRRAITVGLLLGMSLGALEATVIGTAMPTVIATLGGLAHYSWVFSAYLLTSTASVPIWGRLSDLHGRRPVYLTGVCVFLIGSMASGAATSMGTLIAARALQGLGAGGIVPLSVTIIGELYTLRERARTQALFSGVWGVASVAGPLVGGYITDAISWRWVFYLNVPFGFLALATIALTYPKSSRTAAVDVDWTGAALMFASVSAFLLAIGGELGSPVAWLVASALLVIWFLRFERRVAEPILPLTLFRIRLVARVLTVVVLIGMAMFGAIAFIPLFVQEVIGGSATQAGQVLTPLFLGWVSTSILGARLTIQLGYRGVVRAGTVLLTVGFAGLTLLTVDSGMKPLLLACFVMGTGMGLSMLSMLLALQHAVPRSQLGVATSLNQFARSMGAAVGTAAMGAVLARRVADASLGPDSVGLTSIALTGEARLQMASGLHDVFVTGAIVSAAAIVASLFLPRLSLLADATSGDDLPIDSHLDAVGPRPDSLPKSA